MSEGVELAIDGLTDFTVLGSGGFSTVYAAWEEGFRRWVAVKVLHSLDEAGRRRFDRERAIMGQLSDHPNVITPFRFGHTSGGVPFLVMDYVPEGSLENQLDLRGTIPPEEAVGHILSVCDALDHGHRRGILHRDIKPGNILVARSGAKLTDFGIAAIRQATATQVAFTLAHTPPETFAGGTEARDERSDLYSLASTLYTALSGRAPFEIDGPDSYAAYLFRIVQQPVPPIEGLIGSSLHDVVLGALDKDPTQRPQSATTFAAALSEASATPAPQEHEAPARLDPGPVPLLGVTPDGQGDSAPAAAPSHDPPPGAGNSPEIEEPVPGGIPTDGGWPVPPADADEDRRWWTRWGPTRIVAVCAAALAALAGLVVAGIALWPDAGDVVAEVDAAAPGGGDGGSGEDDPEDIGETAGGGAAAPVPGGVLVFGIEAGIADSWAPFELECDTSCAMVLASLSDPIIALDDRGEIVPVLAASVESNDDATVWTVTFREGIRFHDGTDLDASAVKYNFDVCRASTARGPELALIEEIAVAAPYEVVFRLGAPWAGFPAGALDSTCGAHLMSAEWLRSLPSNPLRSDELPANGNPMAPVSMGPFRLVSDTPGAAESVTVERFDQYWRGSGAAAVTAEGLPYLDRIEFVYVADVAERSAGLRAGDLDIIHTADAIELASFQREGDRFTRAENNRYSRTNFYLINLAAGDLDPDGANATNPLLDRRVRRALAHALDLDRLAEERGAGLVEVANGPFSPGQPGHLADNGYPDFDVAAARRLLDDYLADPERNDGRAAGEPIAFAFDTTADPFNLETNRLIVSIWEEAFGSDVDITVTAIPQRGYVDTALTGTYDVMAWQQHAGFDHDTELRYWSSANATAVDSESVNFGRIADPELDELLARSRTETDPERRREIFEAINLQFAEEVYYLPTHWTIWAVIADPRVHGLEPVSLPDGRRSSPMVNGIQPVARLWCEAGRCP